MEPRRIAVNFPSRYIPLLGLFLATVTIFSSVALTNYYGNDVGGLPWPYIRLFFVMFLLDIHPHSNFLNSIAKEKDNPVFTKNSADKRVCSDLAKDAPQAGVFAYGMTVTSCVLIWVVVINYGKIKNDITTIACSAEGRKRNQLALVFGLMAAPNLGLLASFDTRRSPELHLFFVILFFLPCIGYLFLIKSVYEHVLRRALLQDSKKNDANSNSVSASDTKSYVPLQTSLWWKRIICNIFLVAVTLYLPVGMSLVTDWQDYSNDVLVHTMRAVAQHVSVLCLCCFFGTMYYDFGDLEFFVIQE